MSALLSKTSDILKIDIDDSGIQSEGQQFELKINKAMENSQDLAEYVSKLEDADVSIEDNFSEDNLVQLRLFNSDSLITQWWGKFPQEIWKSDGSHVELTHGVVFGPCILESFDIFLLECQNIIFVLCLLVVIERFTNNGNENIHENEEGEQCVCEPEQYGYDSFASIAVVHDSVP